MALSPPNIAACRHGDIECGVNGTCIIGDRVLCNMHQLPCDRNSFVSSVETGVSPLGHCMKARDWGALFSGLCLVAGKVGPEHLHPLVVTLLCCIVLGMVLRLRKRSLHVKLPLQGRMSIKGALMIQPDEVLGVEVSSLSPPVFLSGVQKQVRGDGNCFWRSCAAFRSPWKKLKHSVVSGYHCMSDTFMPFQCACLRRPGFGCHVEHASKKNAWVNIDMIQVYAADQETQVVLYQCTAIAMHDQQGQ
eukprot:6457282-Amphidinium_carterae.1